MNPRKTHPNLRIPQNPPCFLQALSHLPSKPLPTAGTGTEFPTLPVPPAGNFCAFPGGDSLVFLTSHTVGVALFSQLSLDLLFDPENSALLGCGGVEAAPDFLQGSAASSCAGLGWISYPAVAGSGFPRGAQHPDVLDPLSNCARLFNPMRDSAPAQMCRAQHPAVPEPYPAVPEPSPAVPGSSTLFRIHAQLSIQLCRASRPSRIPRPAVQDCPSLAV